MYWFLDKNGNVLYVGKAKNLKKRISSYTYLSRLPARTLQLVQTATTIKTQNLDSELEALLVEAELIRTYRPPFNILLKDDKSPIYIQITDEKFPRVNMVRKSEIISQHLKGTILGPFQTTYKLREVMDLARRIFPWCNERGNAPQPQSKACFYYHIGLCPGACVGEVNATTYQAQVHELMLFLRGKKRQVTKNLQQAMKDAATQENYEQAAILRDQLRVITEVTQPQYKLKPDLLLSTSLTDNQAQDRTIHLRRILHNYLHTPANYQLRRLEGYDVSNISGQLAAVAMVTFENGQPAKDQYRLFNIRTLNTPNDYHMLKEAIIRRQNHPDWGRPDLVIIDGGKGQLRAALSVWRWRCPVISIAKHPDRLIIPDLSEVKNSAQDLITANANSPSSFHKHDQSSGEKDTGNIGRAETTKIKSKRSYVSSESPESTAINLKGIKYHELKLPAQHPGMNLVQHVRDEAHRFSKKQFTRRKLKNFLSS